MFLSFAIGRSERRLIGHSYYRRNFLRKRCATCRPAAPRTEKSDKPAQWTPCISRIIKWPPEVRNVHIFYTWKIVHSLNTCRKKICTELQVDRCIVKLLFELMQAYSYRLKHFQKNKRPRYFPDPYLIFNNCFLNKRHIFVTPST
jgi:hypothetical protein